MPVLVGPGVGTNGVIADGSAMTQEQINSTYPRLFRNTDNQTIVIRPRTIFNGSFSRVAINIVIASNETNYVLNTAKAAGYVAGVSDVTLTINSGVYVSANSTGTAALQVDTSWNPSDTISIVNNGFIVGMGGSLS